MEGILIPIVISLGAFAMVVFLRKYSNSEKMAMIEKGADPKLFQHHGSGTGPLRFALLAIGAGIGLLIGSLLYENSRMDEEVAYFSMIFIFGGLGLVASYIIEQKRKKKEEV